MKLHTRSPRLQAELWLRLHGGWPFALAALLLAVILVHGLVLPGKAGQIDAMAARVRGDQLQAQARARHLEATRQQAEAARRAAPADVYGRFDTLLAGNTERSKFIRDIWQQASLQQVRLGKIDFREERDAAGGFLRLRIHVPTVGSYPAVKRLAFGLMRAYPSLAMDAIEFKRDRAQGELEGTLHFTLMMRF